MCVLTEGMHAYICIQEGSVQAVQAVWRLEKSCTSTHAPFMMLLCRNSMKVSLCPFKFARAISLSLHVLSPDDKDYINMSL
jgi:hypothetical protein